MRLLLTLLVFASLALLASAKIIGGKTPPGFPDSYYTNFSSVYSGAPDFAPHGFTASSGVEKVFVKLCADHIALSRLYLFDSVHGVSDTYKKLVAPHGGFCFHSRHPQPMKLNTTCTEFSYNPQATIGGVSGESWQTRCSDPHQRSASLTYLYGANGNPSTIQTQFVTGPEAGETVTITLNGFTADEPKAALFEPPVNCTDPPMFGHDGEHRIGGGGGMIGGDGHDTFPRRPHNGGPLNFHRTLGRMGRSDREQNEFRGGRGGGGRRRHPGDSAPPAFGNGLRESFELHHRAFRAIRHAWKLVRAVNRMLQDQQGGATPQ